MIIGDGDDMAMVGHFVQIHGNALIKFEDVILRADHIWADFDDQPDASLRKRPPKDWERRNLFR